MFFCYDNEVINVINFSNETFESQFAPVVNAAYTHSLKLLDKLPETINIKFTDNGASDITGVGGFTESKTQINIAILEQFEDQEVQQSNLYATVMHEAFHVQQGFTHKDAPFTALDSAIYEGCAIAYEREYAKGSAIYSDYGSIPETTLRKWLEDIKLVGMEYFEDANTWHKWAFYHPEYDQKWIIYKVGAWLVDSILLANNVGILDLKDKMAGEILSYSPIATRQST